jgi:hypothetical protein
MADQHETKSQLAEPLLGDAEVKQHLITCGWRGEGVVESSVGDGDLPVDELAAGIELICQCGDGLGSSEPMEPNLLPLAERQGLGRALVGNCLLPSSEGGSRMAHVCFLHETGDFWLKNTPVWGKQTI